MKRTYIVTLKNGKQLVDFETVAKSEAEAIRIVRKFHKGRHIVKVKQWTP
jgi:hypothetical protein